MSESAWAIGGRNGVARQVSGVEGSFAPETCLATPFRFQIGSIISEMYVPLYKNVLKEATLIVGG